MQIFVLPKNVLTIDATTPDNAIASIVGTFSGDCWTHYIQINNGNIENNNINNIINNISQINNIKNNINNINK